MLAHKKESHIQAIYNPTPCLSLEQLLQYSEHRLSAPDRFQVERHLIDCDLCSEALEGLALSKNKSTVPHTIGILNKDIHEYKSSPSTNKYNWRVIYSIAAVLVLALTSVLYFQNKQPQYESLYAEYFTPYPNMTPLVRGEESAGTLESAMVEYESGNYGESLKLLKGLLEKEPENNIAQLYAGISSLCLNDPQSAITYLHTVAKNKDSDVTDHATWYIGLAYLKEKNRDAATACFRRLSQDTGIFSKNSSELLKRLE